MLIASPSGSYYKECINPVRIMIENEQKIVNGKSLLGLLSLYDALDKPLQLIVEGPDEEEAAAAVLSFIGLEK